ncbi:hypothetical protein T492DRAFT_1152303 [Pavlovales sp. CCMP2436]|nr:hypothetical protein T492DRAFT_1152303 [Pavlovales sp. CCMP2436]
MLVIGTRLHAHHVQATRLRRPSWTESSSPLLIRDAHARRVVSARSATCISRALLEEHGGAPRGGGLLEPEDVEDVHGGVLLHRVDHVLVGILVRRDARLDGRHALLVGLGAVLALLEREEVHLVGECSGEWVKHAAVFQPKSQKRRTAVGQHLKRGPSMSPPSRAARSCFYAFVIPKFRRSVASHGGK